MFNLKPIALVCGTVVCSVGFLLFIPLLTELFYQTSLWESYAVPILIYLIVGGALVITNKNVELKITTKEAFIITVLSWLLLSILCAIPFIYTDAELADLLSKLPLSRQRLSFPNRSLLHSSSDANSIPLSMPAANSTTHRDFCRTSRSVEREVFRNELNFIESNEADLWNEMRIRRQTNLVMLNQRNQLMKINEGLAKYIAHNSK